MTLVVRVLNGTLSEGRSVPVRVITADRTAQGNDIIMNIKYQSSEYALHIWLNFTAPSDYTSISSVLMFSSLSTNQTVEVSISNDDLLEINEVFTAMLQLVNEFDSQRVMLQPNEASVTILDEDGEFGVTTVRQ